MRPVHTQASSRPRLPRRHYATALALIALAFAGVLLMRGDGGAWLVRVIAVVDTLARGGFAPLLYLLAAQGYGRLSRPMLAGRRGRWCIELGFGLTLLLSLSHLAGMLGLLGVFSAWLIVAVGVVLFAPTLHRSGELEDRPRSLTPVHAAIGCGIALVLVMACNPPGALWGSEYGGFDALSYHLQLPHEWIEQGRIWPSEHNVYSFLPSSIEGAYAHMALLGGGGMHADDARGAMSAHLLSAMMLILSGLAIAELTRAGIERVGIDADRDLAWLLGLGLTLGTPWLLVVGTLAYNEVAVVLLGACALLAAMQTDIAPWKRGVLCGLIVGGACSCKPTALFLLAPSVGVVLLACVGRRQWIGATLACCVAGALTIAPWLIRNELAAGNPVFPQLAGLFGSGHWTAAQHAVYADAHSFDGSILDRFALLVVPDAGGMDHVSRFRGFTNGQWALTPLLGLAGLVSLLAVRSTRRAGLVAVLALGLPIVAWAMLTHLQSRFLIPLAPILIALGSAAIARIRGVALRAALARVVVVAAVLWSTALAMVQHRGNPFVYLDLGPGLWLGTVEIEGEPWTAALNRLTGEGDTVYLLGDATPFYVRGAVRYNTVYDRWLIEDAIGRHPDDPARWTDVLRDAGVDVVVVGFSEIDRYARSGWLPESIDLRRLSAWIDGLGEPVLVWRDRRGVPLRAVYRLGEPAP